MVNFLLIFVFSLLSNQILVERTFNSFTLNKFVENHGEAKIVLEKKNNKIFIKSVFQPGFSKGNFFYKLATRKAGPSGSSNNRQSGTFEVKNNQEEIILSTTAMNVAANDKLEIALQVYFNQQLISEDILHYQAQ